MRILVFSDTHGRTAPMERVIMGEPRSKHIFFLGDTVRDAEKMQELFPDRIFHIVRGNCDFSPAYSEEEYEEIDGVGIFYCHGHTYSVNSGEETLYKKGESLGAKIVLYGHTHCLSEHYRDGIHIVNPGSLSKPRDGAPSYAMIETKRNGILINTIRL